MPLKVKTSQFYARNSAPQKKERKKRMERRRRRRRRAEEIENTSWKLLAHGIYARVVDVSEIELVSAAHE